MSQTLIQPPQEQEQQAQQRTWSLSPEARAQFQAGSAPVQQQAQEQQGEITVEGEPGVIGTIKDDLHDIGKNLVRMMMESKGLNVIDLGNSVPPAKYIEAAAKHNADIIACSALLTTTMVHIKDVVKGVAESPLAGKVKIMIGGAPVNDAFRESIGADYYTPDASSAAEKALEICAAARV